MNALDDLASDNDRLRLLRIETISVEVVRRRYKAAFDISMKAIEAGLSANLASFQPNWDQGFKKD